MGILNRTPDSFYDRGATWSFDAFLRRAEELARDALAQPGPLRPYILDTLAHIQLRQQRYSEALDLVEQAEKATPLENTLVREQLKATRDSIQAAAKPREHAPGQVPRTGP